MPEDAIRIVKEANNFASFNPMQEKAIKAGVLEKSLIVSSPTASGKTILAEIAALNSVLNKGKKVVYTCPLRALASEHFNDFKTKHSQAHSIKAVLSTGDFDSSGSYLSNKDVIFTTYERLNSLITHKAEWLGQIGLLVVDEIHVLGSDRGPALEMLVTKLRFLNKEMQILGLSATIPNAKELAEWLGAVLVESDFRPVKLKEGILLESSLFFGSSKQELIPEKDSVSTVALDTLEKGKQALIFTNTRKASESHAKKLAPIVSRRLSAEEKKALEKASEKALNALEQPTTQCRAIASLIKDGVCFHNAGLLQKQREIIEELFRKNLLKFICSTPTLAAGINMPAFRVVITSPY
ncbi:MAG TPA: DEAD/DEAH box helicase, partial [archaeon]|nr:DEAD/DEAH box helicase [archaeon]